MMWVEDWASRQHARPPVRAAHKVLEAALEHAERLLHHRLEARLAARDAAALALDVGAHARQHQPLVDEHERVHEREAERRWGEAARRLVEQHKASPDHVGRAAPLRRPSRPRAPPSGRAAPPRTGAAAAASTQPPPPRRTRRTAGRPAPPRTARGRSPGRLAGRPGSVSRHAHSEGPRPAPLRAPRRRRLEGLLAERHAQLRRLEEAVVGERSDEAAADVLVERPPRLALALPRARRQLDGRDGRVVADVDAVGARARKQRRVQVAPLAGGRLDLAVQRLRLRQPLAHLLPPAKAAQRAGEVEAGRVPRRLRARVRGEPVEVEALLRPNGADCGRGTAEGRPVDGVLPRSASRRPARGRAPPRRPTGGLRDGSEKGAARRSTPSLWRP